MTVTLQMTIKPQCELVDQLFSAERFNMEGKKGADQVHSPGEPRSAVGERV